MPAKTENTNEAETISNALSDFSGRFDDLGEDLMKLSSQEHICTIYRKDEDKIDSIMEFLKTGIVKKERSVIIVDKQSKADILKKMKLIEDIKNLLNTSAIVFVDSEDIYGNKSDFNLAKTIDLIEPYLEVPQEDNFNGLRMIIEILPFKNKDTTMNMSLEFHSSIDILLSNRDISFFCLYNEYKFESKTLLNVIFSHSKLIFNGFLCENFFSMDPHKLQITQEDKLEDTLYKKTVYEIVQGEISKQKRVKTDSYVQKETLKGINDSVFILDLEGNILEVNDAAFKTRGYTEEEMLSLNILDIMSSENKDLFDSRIEELKKRGEITFETTHYCKDGTILDVEFKTKIISYDDQQHILSVGRDITERKRAENEAKFSEEKYRSIFNNANDAIFLLKECVDGRFNKIVGANKQAVKMYGYSEEELFKMSPDDFNATGYVETKETLNEFLKERSIKFERTHKTKDGKIIHVEVSSQLFELDGETVSHAMVQDVTDRKKTQEELINNKYELGERVKELTTIYNISKILTDTDKRLEDVLSKIVEFIPPCWQFPECTVVRILLKGQQFKSESFVKSQWKQEVNIHQEDEIVGRVEIYYTESKPDSYEGPFLKEERDVLEEIARLISNFISRKEVTEELRKSETHYRSIFETTGAANIIVDENLDILHMNSIMVDLIGYTKEETIGKKKWSEFILQTELPRLLEYNRKRFENPSSVPKNYETKMVNRLGEIRDVLISEDIITGTKTVIASLLDITDRKKIENALKESEVKFRVLFNEMKQAYALYEVIYDEKGDPVDALLVEINPEYEQLVNKKREEIIGKKITEIYPNLKKQEVNPIAVLGRTAITGETVISEHFNQDLGKWFLAKSFSPMKDHVAVLYEDVTEKRKIENDLIASELKFRSIFNHSNDGYILRTAEGIILEANPKFLELFGYEASEVISNNIRLINAYETDEDHISRKKEINEKGYAQFETLATRIDGSLFPMEVNAVKLLLGNEEVVFVIVRDITERKEAEKDLLQSEEKYRSIFENSFDGISIVDIDGTIIDINKSGLNGYGYEKSEMVGKNVSDFDTYIDPEFAEKIRQNVIEEKYITSETIARRKDGTSYHQELSVDLVNLGDKQVILTKSRNITERIKNEEKLKSSEEKLRRLNEELEEKVIQRTYQMETLYNIIKEISEIFDLNEAMRIITKYISKLVDYDIIVQLISQEKLNHIHIDAPKGDKEVVDDFIKNVKEEFEELYPDALNNRDAITIITSDKKTIQNISSQISIPLIAEDKVVGFVAIGSEQEDVYIEEEIWFLYKIADNISHALQRLKVILTAKHELETVLDHTSDSVILINNADSVVMTNKAGGKFLELINYSETAGIDNEILNLEELKRIDKKELSLHGKIYYVSMNPIKTDFVHGWLLVIHDITEEREMQKKILHQERLATLGKITGGIAHDFNNILASIIGAADFSLMSADNIESKEFLNLIIRQSEKGASLIRQMLDFTRQAVIRPKPVSLLDFISEFSRVIRSSLPENITLSVYTGDWKVFIDQVQLQQLLLNLIFNAKDSLVQGGRISVSVEEIKHSKILDFEEIEIDKNQDYLHFIIEDNGKGMNEQTKKMIFEPFFTTKDPGKGSGLGLSQVYGIVRQSNGYIYVESEMKVGTKVHFYIPKYEGLVEEEIVDSTRLGEGRILLVEDDEDVREITKIMLENYGYVVVTAENGKIALDLYNDSFDLVLTDIVMPVMGGEKLIEKLLEINPQIKCLAMTGYSDASVPEVVKVLNKPITSSKLVNQIQNELEQENSQEKIDQYKKREDGG